MNDSDILKIRLHNQLLDGYSLKEPEEIVSWMGAMQAQALDIAKWALGARLENSSVKTIEDALTDGKIIRTHILRPTWHFVAAEDIHWMRKLSVEKLRAVYISYGKSWGADEDLILKTRLAVTNILEKHDYLYKQEIDEHLKAIGHDVDPHTLSHALSHSELEGIICNGKISGQNHSYALLEKRVLNAKVFIKEEALKQLAFKYFSSHGPATLQDFIWWSGLTATEAKAGLESVKNHFISEKINEKIFWMKPDIQIPENKKPSALLLPPFDEFVVSYKDRSEIIEKEHHSKVMTKNGIFSPTIMLNGEIIGSWKKIKKKNKVQVELKFFEKTNKKTVDLYKNEIKRVEEFYAIQE
ncbi:MAG: winged helix DNA-binding domain-containing protein [Bacteroidales bacterium]|jgi:hypothetical protein|nr:winged helix DNA-binding domain-containing protein [Bacteroidales bacterium]